MYRNTILNDSYDKDFDDIDKLIKGLVSYNILESTNNETTQTNK